MRKMKKLSIMMMCGLGLLLTSCDKGENGGGTDNQYSVAEKALLATYPDAQNISWSTQNDYQVAKFFSAITKDSNTSNYTVWYSVSGDDATEKKSNQQLSNELNTLPQIIQDAFAATEYSNTELWKIDEVEKDVDYRDDDDDNNSAKIVIYEIELEGLGVNVDMDVELKFDENGTLIFKKEEQDNDNDDDTIIITAEMQQSVEDYLTENGFMASGSKLVIIDAEKEDNNTIEVEAAVILGSVVTEFELDIDATTFEVKNFEYDIEQTVTWADLDSQYKTPITEWYTTEQMTLPADTTEIEVEIETEEIDGSVGKYLNVEIDFDYTINGVEYEASFKLRKAVDSTDAFVIYESEVEIDD